MSSIIFAKLKRMAVYSMAAYERVLYKYSNSMLLVYKYATFLKHFTWFNIDKTETDSHSYLSDLIAL